MENQFKIVAIQSTVGGYCTFFLTDTTDINQLKKIIKIVDSSSELILSTLIPLFLAQSIIILDLFPKSSIINRVEKTDYHDGLNDNVFDGDYHISRIATQRNSDGVEHLEVVIATSGGEVQNYNVYDPLLQKIFQAVFLIPNYPRIHIEIDGGNIYTVRLGAKYVE